MKTPALFLILVLSITGCATICGTGRNPGAAAEGAVTGAVVAGGGAMDTWVWADAFKSAAIGDLGLAASRWGSTILVGTATYAGGCWMYVKTHRPEPLAQPASVEIQP